jgi:hypothetical protein
MHFYQNQLIVQAQDPDNAARIVRNIADIERDSQIAWGLLSDRLMAEAVDAMLKAVAERWPIIDTGTETLLVPTEWKQMRGVGHGDAWLQLADICEDEDNAFSWIITAVGAGPIQLGLELWFRRGLADLAQSAIEDDKAVADLLALSFARDSAKARLFLPILIPIELLAKAFEENDFTEAMVPINRAVEQAVTAKTELDAFIDHVRAQTKRA